MVKKILQFGNKTLLETSKEIEDIDSDETKQLAQDLLDTVVDKQRGAAGLSAVQIGVLKRMFIVRRMDLNDDDDDTQIQWEIMINPEIEYLTTKNSLEWEGCLSIKSEDRLTLYGPVFRPRKIKVHYSTLLGERKTLQAEDFFSHLIQHELDHLNGKLFLSYVTNVDNIWKEDEFNAYIKKYDRLPPVK